MLSKRVQDKDRKPQKSQVLPRFSNILNEPVPKYSFPEKSANSDVTYELIRRELNLDGNPALNLASFVTTWMEPQIERLMSETLNKNYIDQDEYPQTTEIQNRCVNMLAHLFNAHERYRCVGTGTVGSSEAIHLAGLALKWNWRKRRRAAGKASDKPNIVMGENVQVCWEKFARYFEVEPRFVKLTQNRYVIGVPEAMELVDENTIAVVGILGSTYTGEYEPVEQLNNALMDVNDKTGWEVPIHVDAASGGFVAPFTSPELKWDFRLPLVKSINVSGHKYGLVYPGVGWVIWRDESELPEDLIFHVNYLGGDQPTFNLNFSRGANQIIAQYYNFVNLGRDGYKRVMNSLQERTHILTKRLEESGRFEIVSKLGHLPVVAFTLKDNSRYTVFDISDRLRERGWIVPAYTLAPDAENISVLRVVVREDFTEDMSDMLINDIERAVEYFEKAPSPLLAKGHERKTRGVC